MCSTMEQMGLDGSAPRSGTAGQCEIGIRFKHWLLRPISRFSSTAYTTCSRCGKTATFMLCPRWRQRLWCTHLGIQRWRKRLGDEYAGLSEAALYYIGGIANTRAINAFLDTPLTATSAWYPVSRHPSCWLIQRAGQHDQVPYEPSPKVSASSSPAIQRPAHTSFAAVDGGH